MLINGALSCWNMKNSPAAWRLHPRTHRMTDCTFPLLPRRKTLQRNVCFARDPRSASRWWCRSVCQNWAALVWYSSNLESRWMEPTTATFCSMVWSFRRRGFCSCNIIMLPDIRHIAREFFIFQQDSSPAHRARETILNARPLLSFRRIRGRHNSPTSIQLTTKSGAWCSSESTRRKCRTWTIWGSIWLTYGTEWNKALLTTPLTIGADISVHVFRPKEDILNIHCDLSIF